MEHKSDDLLTNRPPLIRRLGWRSFLTGKVRWGHLSAENRALMATHDALHRLTYRENLAATPFAIKVSLQFSL